MMKVLIDANEQSLDASLGGAFSFTASILDELMNYTGDLEFYFFDASAKSIKKVNKLTVMPSKFYKNLLKKSFAKRVFCKIKRKIFKTSVLQAFRPINNAISDLKIDLVWFLNPSGQIVDVPFVFTVWDLQHRKQPCFPEVNVVGDGFFHRDRHFQYFLPRASTIVVGNETGRGEISSFFNIPKERIKILPMPVSNFFIQNSDKTDFDEKIPEQIARPFVFYPAQFWPHKNHVTILHAIKILKQEHKVDMSVVFVGSDKGNMGYIKNLVTDLKLDNKVHILGFVSREMLLQLYKKSMALVFASFFGPDNIPPLEAFATGCPVICADFDGSREQMQDAALFFDPKSELGLATQIKKIFENENLRDELVIRGKEIVKNRTSSKYVAGMVEILEDFRKIRRCWGSIDGLV
jgi:glycosyltransferase involved in cell wall biosynthesis